MRLFDLARLAAQSPEGEHVLGAADLATHACYLIYGRVEPGQPARLLRPGPGHEEIVCLVSGRLRVEGGVIEAGQAFHLVGEEQLRVTAEGEEPAVYIIAGGHGQGAHHHH